jgi:hypothetical protein
MIPIKVLSNFHETIPLRQKLSPNTEFYFCVKKSVSRFKTIWGKQKTKKD